MPEQHLEMLESRRCELVQAFSTVLEFIDVFTEMGESMPPGVYSYLWSKWFKLDGLDSSLLIEEEEE